MTHQEEATLPEELMQLLCDPQAGEGRFWNPPAKVDSWKRDTELQEQ